MLRTVHTRIRLRFTFQNLRFVNVTPGWILFRDYRDFLNVYIYPIARHSRAETIDAESNQWTSAQQSCHSDKKATALHPVPKIPQHFENKSYTFLCFLHSQPVFNSLKQNLLEIGKQRKLNWHFINSLVFLSLLLPSGINSLGFVNNSLEPRPDQPKWFRLNVQGLWLRHTQGKLNFWKVS